MKQLVGHFWLTAILAATAWSQLSLVSPAAITFDGNVSPDPNTVTLAQDLFIADLGDGNMTIDMNSDVQNRFAYIGNSAGTEGNVSVDGTGSSWTSSQTLYVGNQGNGNLAITAGAKVNSLEGRIGSAASSTGHVTVDGNNSNWTNAVNKSMYVGYEGNGTLAITGNGEVSSTTGYIGYETGSTGKVTVDGADSSWSNGGTLHVGNRGNGLMQISGGGQVTNNAGIIGRYSGSKGNVSVAGIGTIWENGSNLYVGFEGNGSLIIVSGADVFSNFGYVNYDSESAGVFVQGLGSSWTNSNDLVVGRDGNGTLYISRGGLVSNAVGTLGLHAGATGSVTVDGNNSTWINNSHLDIGSEGNGELTITNGGHVFVNGDLTVTSDSTLTFGILSASDPFMDVNGSASLAGTLSVVLYLGNGLYAGDELTLIDVSTSSTGQFLGLDEGDLVDTFEGIELRISYVGGGDGNDVVLYTPKLGDMNGDGLVNLDDTAPFILALTNRAAYDQQYGALANADFVGDFDHNGLVDLGDIGPFSALMSSLSETSAAAVPEPATIGLLCVGCVAFVRLGGRRVSHLRST